MFAGIIFVILLLGLTLLSLKLYIKLTTGICNSQTCLKGKTAIVTGANTGIGYETALDFAKRGARVILACRDKTKANEAAEKIKRETDNDDVCWGLVDFSSFRSVRRFANDINNSEERLDILVNNAGAATLGDNLTEDGLPILIQTNYLSHFLLTNLLLDLLKKTPSRVVNVSAIGAKLGRIDLGALTKYEGNAKQYIKSKLCQILFTIEFASRFSNTNVTAYSLHPGLIVTEIFRSMPSWKKNLILFVIKTFFKTTSEGAQTQIHCAVAKGLEKYNGKHFHDCRVVGTYASASDLNLAKMLWEESAKIVNLVKYLEGIKLTIPYSLVERRHAGDPDLLKEDDYIVDVINADPTLCVNAATQAGNKTNGMTQTKTHKGLCPTNG